MKKIAIFICFIWPLICSCLNLQLLIGTFISVGISQIIAYINLLLLILGIFLILKKDTGEYSKTAALWIYFFILYYTFGLLANGVTGFINPEYSILASLVPFVYFIAFYFFLSNDEFKKTFIKVLTISYFLSSLLTIFFFKINYDFDYGGIPIYPIDRAGGVYGDANNASFVSILTYILVAKMFVPKNKIQYILKIIALFIIFYSLLITFSTTGLFIFSIVFLISNYKFFKGLKLILLGISLIFFYLFLINIKSFTTHLNLNERQLGKINNIVNVLTFNTEEIDSSGRTELVQKLLHYVYENPVFGNGIGFSNFIRGHNTYIGVWGDAGILTFLFFIFMLIIYLLKSLSLDNNLRFFCFSILTTIYIFMLTLQTVINQPYIIVLFIFIGYIIDNKTNVKNKMAPTEDFSSILNKKR
ncbi:hypothetical protein [Formosa sp. PL04]|uniref:O-antigen ligase family protein n=1 Tax=Formosa sp. PL04 TaxID=3081755 RepID=UPI002981411E|nr:hypothetical protein [Formosa sp. PL04]MDW5289363.1 hypothetical protein [Formosa sp. PL04]